MANNSAEPQGQLIHQGAYWLIGVFWLAAQPFAFQRVYTRLRLAGRFTVGDYVFLGGWASSYVVNILTILIFREGYIRTSAMTYDEQRRFMILSYFKGEFYPFNLFLQRVSIGLFYMQLSPALWMRRCILVLLVVAIVTFIISRGIECFACRVLTLFEAGRPDINYAGVCDLRAVTNWWYGAFEIVVDLGLLFTALGTVLPLQMKPSLKGWSIVLFCIASLTCATAAVRLSILILASESWSVFAQAGNQPVLHQLIVAEGNMAVICGSSVTLGKLAGLLMPQLSARMAHLAPEGAPGGGWAGGNANKWDPSKKLDNNDKGREPRTLLAFGGLGARRGNLFGRPGRTTIELESLDGWKNSPSHTRQDPHGPRHQTSRPRSVGERWVTGSSVDGERALTETVTAGTTKSKATSEGGLSSDPIVSDKPQVVEAYQDGKV